MKKSQKINSKFIKLKGFYDIKKILVRNDVKLIKTVYVL